MNKTFIHAQIFNGVTDQIQLNSYFTVNEQGHITALGTGVPETNVDIVTDLHNQYVMPGLINAHTHIMMDPYSNRGSYLSETEVTFRALKNLKALLHDGVTYIRDCGCAFGVDVKLENLQHMGLLGGTEIYSSGRPMTIIGGHGDSPEGIDGESNMGHLVSSIDDMRKAVRENFKLGTNNVKVMATGGVMSSTDEVDDTELTEAEIRVAVEEAHSKHMTVASHAQGHRGIQLSIEAGVDSIEHGIYIDEQQVAYMKAHDIYLVPTLNACDSIDQHGAGKIPAYMLRKNNLVKQDFYRNMTMALKAGIKFAVGTDAGTPFNSFATGTTEELALLVKLGLTPYQALLGTTQNAAHLLRIADHYGSLAVGKVADFLVLNANPLADITAVQQPDKRVYKKGTLVK